MFAAFSAQPVASASLGQVYQATLRPEYGGGCVAVKVQRPGIMEHVALDTLLMRGATEIVSAVPYFSDSWCEVLDDWATRFFLVCPCLHQPVLELITLAGAVRNVSLQSGVSGVPALPCSIAGSLREQCEPRAALHLVTFAAGRVCIWSYCTVTVWQPGNTCVSSRCGHSQLPPAILPD